MVYGGKPPVTGKEAADMACLALAGYKQKEIAERMGRSQATVSNNLADIHEAVRKYYGGELWKKIERLDKDLEEITDIALSAYRESSIAGRPDHMAGALAVRAISERSAMNGLAKFSEFQMKAIQDEMDADMREVMKPRIIKIRKSFRIDHSEQIELET